MVYCIQWTITEDEMVGRKGALTLPEYLNVLKKMSNGKSPGLDGFTSEFYKLFWIDIHEYVIKSLNVAYENSLLLGKMFQNVSSLKPLGQLKPNCPGMIIGRSSTNFKFFMPIGNPRWPPPQDID